MKKIIAVACLSLAALGFSATSALAAKDLTNTGSPSVSIEQLKLDTYYVNLSLINKNYIKYPEWQSNVLKFAYEKDVNKIKSIHDALVNQLAGYQSRR